MKQEIVLEIKNLNKSFLDENDQMEDILTDFNLQVKKMNFYVFLVLPVAEKLRFYAVLEDLKNTVVRYW
jgi:hypothetical protein